MLKNKIIKYCFSSNNIYRPFLNPNFTFRHFCGNTTNPNILFTEINEDIAEISNILKHMEIRRAEDLKQLRQFIENGEGPDIESEFFSSAVITIGMFFCYVIFLS